jgi:hypothetical protein
MEECFWEVEVVKEGGTDFMLFGTLTESTRSSPWLSDESVYT